MIYFGRRYRAALTGSVLRRVKCEKCPCEYAYELVRRATGSGTSPYLLNNAGAQDRAQKQATTRLRKQLEHGVDPVPCPDCGWYQAEMVAEIRRRKLRPLVGIALFCLIAGLTIGTFGGIWWANDNRPWETESWIELGAVVGGLLAASITFTLVRRIVLKQLHPNRDYPALPAPYPGAPIGHRLGGPGEKALPAPSPASDGERGALNYARQRPEVLAGGWVPVQVARVGYPPICCNCMTDTENIALLDFESLVKFPVRLCKRCARANKWRIAICCVVGVLLGWGVVAVWAWTSSVDTTGKQIMTFLLGPFAGLLAGVAGLVLARRFFGAPVQMRGFQSAYNTIEIKFRNGGYTDLFVDTMAGSAKQRSQVQLLYPVLPPKSLKASAINRRPPAQE